MIASYYSLPTINWVRLPATGDQGPSPTLTVAEILFHARAAGFAAVGIDGFTAGGGDPARLTDLLAGRGLRCSDVGVLAVERSDNLARCDRMLALARATGAELCVTTSTIEPGPDLVRELRSCAEALADAGVRLALEFLPYGPLATLPDAISLCATVGWQRCGLLLDSWHFFAGGAPWEVLRALSGEQIALVQINDAPPPITADPQFESRFRRVLPGAGSFALDRFVTTVTATGFRGPVSPEVLSESLRREPPARFAERLMTSLHRTWPLPVGGRSMAPAPITSGTQHAITDDEGNQP